MGLEEGARAFRAAAGAPTAEDIAEAGIDTSTAVARGRLTRRAQRGDKTAADALEQWALDQGWKALAKETGQTEPPPDGAA